MHFYERLLGEVETEDEHLATVSAIQSKFNCTHTILRGAHAQLFLVLRVICNCLNRPGSEKPWEGTTRNAKPTLSEGATEALRDLQLII